MYEEREYDQIIYNEKNEIEYKFKPTNDYFINKTELFRGNKKIGYVKEHYFGLGVPVLEKDAKRVSVYFKNQLIGSYKSYSCFGDFEVNTLEGEYEIKIDKEKQEHKIEKEGKILAKINELTPKFGVEYYESHIITILEGDEEIVLLIAAALDWLK